jgi:bleomycin hydrolase
MKKLLLVLFAGALALAAGAQKAEPFSFKEHKMLGCTPVKNQQQTGTCWAFSTLSFLESEVQRQGKGTVDLSEMFVVRHIYRDKCENYVRRQGSARFGEGGLAHDLLNAVKRHGVVPEQVYPGRKDPAQPLNHANLEKALKTLCDQFVESGKKGEVPDNWLVRIDSVLDAEFGVAPIKFSYENRVFSPLAYRDYLGIRPDDYITVTSFTHHPFFEPFILEIPDNFANGTFYNLPLSELMQCLNYSIEQGFTVEWDADVSNAGFSPQHGLALVPEKSWNDKTEAQRQATFKFWEKQIDVDQEYRQQQFDRQVTQDDHLMHIVGILDEAHDGVYYVVKNSWGEMSDRKGYVYVSEDYMRLNTISFTVHKKALPTEIKRRLGFIAGGAAIEGTAKDLDDKNVRTRKPTSPGSKAPSADPKSAKPRKLEKN